MKKHIKIIFYVAISIPIIAYCINLRHAISLINILPRDANLLQTSHDTYEEKYVFNINSDTVWGDLRNTSPENAGQTMYLRKDDEEIVFFDVMRSTKTASEKSPVFYYIHFFTEGIMYCTVKSPYTERIYHYPHNSSSWDDEIHFFRSDNVNIITWEDFNNIITEIKHSEKESCLILSAEANIPFSKLWTPLKSLISLFPLESRYSVYVDYTYVCSNDVNITSNIELNYNIDAYNFLKNQMEHFNNSIYTKEDIEIIFKADEEHNKELILLLLNIGGEFYDNLFNLDTDKKCRVTF